MRSDTLTFTAAVQAVCQEARRIGLVAPGFRSPPRVEGVDRTIRRGGGQAMVAVRVRGRPVADVAADIVEGVLVVNGVTSDLGIRRRLLWAVQAEVVRRSPGRPGTLGAGARVA